MSTLVCPSFGTIPPFDHSQLNHLPFDVQTAFNPITYGNGTFQSKVEMYTKAVKTVNRVYLQASSPLADQAKKTELFHIYHAYLNILPIVFIFHEGAFSRFFCENPDAPLQDRRYRSLTKKETEIFHQFKHTLDLLKEARTLFAQSETFNLNHFEKIRGNLQMISQHLGVVRIHVNYFNN